jgi:hypothetical protein
MSSSPAGRRVVVNQVCSAHMTVSSREEMKIQRGPGKILSAGC